MTGRAGVTAIVLAGGRSTRFGRDKLAADVDGERLLHRAIRAAGEVADDLVVVLAPDSPVPPLPSVRLPVVVARDLLAGRGPLGGLVAGLAVARHPVALLVGGDQPWLVPAVLRLLVDEIAPSPAAEPPGPLGAPDAAAAALPAVGVASPTGAPDVVALADGDSLWPFPVALRVAVVRPAATTALAGTDLRLFTLFGRLRLARVPEARWRALDRAGASLRDVDTPGDVRPS